MTDIDALRADNERLRKENEYLRSRLAEIRSRAEVYGVPNLDKGDAIDMGRCHSCRELKGFPHNPSCVYRIGTLSRVTDDHIPAKGELLHKCPVCHTEMREARCKQVHVENIGFVLLCRRCGSDELAAPISGETR